MFSLKSILSPCFLIHVVVQASSPFNDTSAPTELPSMPPITAMPVPAPVTAMPVPAPITAMPVPAPVTTMPVPAPMTAMPDPAPVTAMPVSAPPVMAPDPTDPPVPTFTFGINSGFEDSSGSDFPSSFPSSFPSDVPNSMMCESNSACAASNLTGSCCPTEDGAMLSCCGGEDGIIGDLPAATEASCELNPSCAAFNLTGLCCPTTETMFLDCCTSVPDFCQEEGACTVASTRQYIADAAEAANDISASERSTPALAITFVAVLTAVMFH